MLDRVLGRRPGPAKDARPQDDQQKLDEYLDSVRSVERRIAAIEARQKEAALEKAASAPAKRNAADSPPIEIKIPEGDKRSEYMQVMCDLNVLAFPNRHHAREHLHRLDAERRFLSRTRFQRDTHHSTTHHNNGKEKVDKVAAITSSTSINLPTW